jgi:positive regulator of sigma E activity
MTTNARVISINGGQATVAVERSSACSSCPSRAGCCGCAETVIVTVQNDAGARPGNRVEVYSPDTKINLLSMLAFFIPVALPLAGFAIVSYFLGDTAGYIAMAALFAASIAGVIAADRLFLRGRTAARIVRVLDDDYNNK